MTEHDVEDIEQFRPYLRVLARMQLGVQLRGKMDESDVVQQTMLQAHRAWETFQGASHRELAGWLRQILARNLAHAFRDLRRDKRDVRRERSLEAELNASSARLGDLLMCEQTSPEDRAARNERLLQLASALEGMPDDQREAVELHYLHDWPLAEIAERMRRSPAAVGGLLHRGLKRLRSTLHEDADDERR